MTNVTISRELLERIDESAICDGTNATISDDLFTQLVGALDAPRQPEGDAHKHEAQPEVAQNTGSRSMTNKLSSQGCTGCTGVEGVAAPCETPDAVDIFAWATFDGEGSYDLRLYEDNEGYLDDFRDANPLLHPDWVFPLCRLSDAQRAIAELREEISDLHTTMMAAAVEIQEHWQAHCDEEGYGPANLMNRLERGIAAQYGYTAQTLVQIEAERDTLRQQLAELRAQLLAIASAEPRRHTIEWAKAMAATGNNEAYAKWREAFDQRDKLARLLADVKADYTHAIHWEDMHATMKRIDAALAEVKPCLESPAPTT